MRMLATLNESNTCGERSILLKMDTRSCVGSLSSEVLVVAITIFASSLGEEALQRQE